MRRAEALRPEGRKNDSRMGSGSAVSSRTGLRHNPGVPFVYKKSSASIAPAKRYFHDLVRHCLELV